MAELPEHGGVGESPARVWGAADHKPSMFVPRNRTKGAPWSVRQARCAPGGLHLQAAAHGGLSGQGLHDDSVEVLARAEARGEAQRSGSPGPA